MFNFSNMVIYKHLFRTHAVVILKTVKPILRKMHTFTVILKQTLTFLCKNNFRYVWYYIQCIRHSLSVFQHSFSNLFKRFGSLSLKNYFRISFYVHLCLNAQKMGLCVCMCRDEIFLDKKFQIHYPDLLQFLDFTKDCKYERVNGKYQFRKLFCIC